MRDNGTKRGEDNVKKEKEEITKKREREREREKLGA